MGGWALLAYHFYNATVPLFPSFRQSMRSVSCFLSHHFDRSAVTLLIHLIGWKDRSAITVNTWKKSICDWRRNQGVNRIVVYVIAVIGCYVYFASSPCGGSPWSLDCARDDGRLGFTLPIIRLCSHTLLRRAAIQAYQPDQTQRIIQQKNDLSMEKSFFLFYDIVNWLIWWSRW